MPIEWNKVTWYSKIAAVILFVTVFYLGFYLGRASERAKVGSAAVSEDNNVAKKVTGVSATATSNPISIKVQNINEENFTGTMPEISGKSPLVLKARAYIEQKVADFRAEANKDVPDIRKQFGADNPTAQYTIDIAAKEIQSGKTESIVISVYAYTGGANGNSSYRVITAVRPNGSVLALSDKIKKDKQNAFTDFVKKELNDWRPDGSDGSVIFPDEVKKLTFASFSDWSLDDKNLIIYFDKYSIGPGSLGAVAFPLSLNKIKDFLQ